MSRKGWPKHEDDKEHLSGEFKSNSTGQVVYAWNYDATYARLQGDANGGNSPNWPSVKSENPYAMYILKTRATPYSLTGNAISADSRGDGTLSMMSAIGISDPAGYLANFGTQEMVEAMNKCTSALIKNIKSQKVNVAQFAAEFKETCQTVVSAATRIGNAVQSLKHGNIGAALRGLAAGGGSHGGRGGGGKPPKPRVTGSVAGDFLAIQYGWRPLLSDVYGACEELARLSTYNPPAVSAQGNGNGSSHASGIYPANGANRPDISWSVDIECSAKAHLEYKVGNEMSSDLSRLGITNPAAVIWEKIPYSFVADWFLPVGSFLNSFDYDFGLLFSRGFITKKAKVTARWKSIHTEYQTGPDHYTFHGDGLVSMDNVYFEREILSGFPAVNPPPFKDPTSLLHVSEAIALMRQRFGS